MFQLEDAIRYRQLHVTNTKDSLKRDILVYILIKEKILKDLVAYLCANGQKYKDYLICDNHKHNVKKEKAYLQNLAQ